MSEERKPRVVGGVRFVWMPKIRGEILDAHWLSTCCPWTVRVFEPDAETSEWCAVINKDGFMDSTFKVIQKKVWKQAAEWAKLGKKRQG